MDQRVDHIKMNSDYLQIQKWMLETVRVEKLDEKMGSFVQFPCFLPDLWSVNCPKKCIFTILCWPQQEIKSVKAICIYASKSSHYTLSENVMVCSGLSHRSWDISD